MSVRLELFVDDPHASVEFYTRVLGFVVERQDASYASLTCGTVVIGIGPVDGLPEDGPGPGFTAERVRAGRGAGVEVVLEVDDVHVALARVRSCGVEPAEDLQLRPWGLRDFRLVDPDGYYLRVTGRPSP